MRLALEKQSPIDQVVAESEPLNRDDDIRMRA
jgi:hypothetical protein